MRSNDLLIHITCFKFTGRPSETMGAFSSPKYSHVIINSQGYCRFRLFWKYAEIGYFGRLKLFPFHGLTRVHFSLFSENNGLLNIYMLK